MIRALAAAEKQEALAARRRAAGQIDESDVVEGLELGDVDALLELAIRVTELTISEEPDLETDRHGAL